MDAERQQPDFRMIGDGFRSLGDQFRLCANLPAVDEGNGVLRALERIEQRLVTLQREQEATRAIVERESRRARAEYVPSLLANRQRTNGWPHD
jgi:hypothetical protein